MHLFSANCIYRSCHNKAIIQLLQYFKHSQEEALTSSPIASHLFDFSAADDADLFSEALLSTSSVDVASAATAVPDPSVPSCSYDDASFVAAALSMDPAALSSLLSQLPDTEPDGLAQAINSGGSCNWYAEAALTAAQQEQFDQIVSDGFSTAAYTAGTMLPAVYDEEGLVPAGLTDYAKMEAVSASGPFMDPVIGGLMYQGQGGYFPAMVGPAEGYQTEAAAAALGIHYGMETLQQVYSTSPDDLQAFVDNHHQQQQVHAHSNSPTAVTDMSSGDDSTFKAVRLSAEERKEKIHRYMKKRNERNFSKKIKYACRKTLADSRPRVHGRFAKNEEFGEMARSSSSHNEYDEEEVVVKEEDLFDRSDILAHISGVNSFKYNYTLESWI